MSSVKTYSLSELSKCGSWGKMSLKEPEPELLMEMISMGSKEQVENKRYYVSDTDLIERRFLKDATESFDRDTDPFGESKLFATPLDCVFNIFGIDVLTARLMNESFLTGGSAEIEFSDILKMIKNDKCNFKYASINNKSSDNEKMVAIANVKKVPIVLEDQSGKVWDTSWTTNPDDSNPKILWIRNVVDGYLGIVLPLKELQENGIWKNVCEHDPNNGNTITVRRKVSEIRDELKSLDIPINGAKKKNELVDIYSKSVIFPERFLSSIS